MQNRLKRSGGDFSPPPDGLHNAVCIDYEYLEKVETQYGIKDKVILHWQLQVFNKEGEETFRDDGKRFVVRRWFTSSTHTRSKIAEFLSSWRGKTMTEQELIDLDLNTLIGLNCRVQTNCPLDGNFADVQAVTCPADGVNLQPQNYVRKEEVPDSDGSNPSKKNSLPF